MKTQATILLAIATAFLPGSGWAESATNPSASTPAQPQAIINQSSAKLTTPASEVLKLVVSGVPEPVIKAYIENSTSTFSLTTDNLIQLQGAGVSGTLMADMLTQDKALKDKAAGYAAWANQPQAVTPAPIYPQPAATGYATAAPDYSAAYSPSVAYVGYNDYPSYSYPYYPSYYPWYGYSYFPSIVFGFGGRFGNRFDHGRFEAGGFNHFGGVNHAVNVGHSFAAPRGGFGGGHPSGGGMSGGHGGGGHR